jgi:hypothetical protein
MLEYLLSLDTALLIEARHLGSPEYSLILRILGEIVVIWTALMLIGIWITGTVREDNSYKIKSMQVFFTII